MYTSLKLVFLVLLLVVACDGSCPNKCSCIQFGPQRVAVKCRNVKQVPRDIPSNTVLLNLSGASLNSVQEESFRKLKSLHLIDLSNNSLKFIPKNTFRNLTSLKVINLNGNRIQGEFYLPEGMYKIEMKENLFSLRDLKIILNGLTRLHFLDVSNNGIGPNLTSDVFTGCDDMVYLAMKGCHLENIESGTFKAMKKLSRLDLNSNLLTSVPDLSGLTNIYDVKLQGNHIRNIIQLGTAFHIKRLLTLSLADNQIDNLPASVFQNVAVYWYIDLSFNKLQSIPDKAFYACGDLRELYLHFNKISHISRHSFTGLVNLTKLFLHGNAIKNIDGKGFHNLTNLQILTLFSNPLTKLPAGLFDGMKSSAKVFTTRTYTQRFSAVNGSVVIFCSPGPCTEGEETCVKCHSGAFYKGEMEATERKFFSSATYVSEERRPSKRATDCWVCRYGITDSSRGPNFVSVIQCEPTVKSVKVPKETTRLSKSSLCLFAAGCC